MGKGDKRTPKPKKHVSAVGTLAILAGAVNAADSPPPGDSASPVDALEAWMDGEVWNGNPVTPGDALQRLGDNLLPSFVTGGEAGGDWWLNDLLIVGGVLLEKKGGKIPVLGDTLFKTKHHRFALA